MAETIRLGARLRAARKAAGYKTSKTFLKQHHVPASTYSQHESGARLPDDETLRFYSKAFGVNFDWLKTGKGQPFKKVPSPQKSIMKEELLDLTPQSTSPVNQQLLSKILEKILIPYFPAEKSLAIKIAKKTIKNYTDTINKNITKEK